VDDAKNCYLPLDDYKLPSIRESERICTHMPDLICLIGGHSTENKPLNNFQIYNPLTKRWSSKGGMKNARACFSAVAYDKKLAFLSTCRKALVAAFLDGTLYAIGGHGDDSFYSSVEAYSPEKNEWSPRSSMSQIRTHAAAVVLDGLIYVMGGSDRVNVHETVEQYSPTTRKWEKLPPMLGKRRNASAAVLNGKIYVCGG
ncbi:kelch repeat protein, partial [Ancylostoma duodenale]